LNFRDLHILIGAESGVSDGRTFRRWRVAGYDFKFARIAAALDFVKVTIAPGARHRERTRGDELADVRAMAVEDDGAALGLGDLEKVLADTGKTNGLRGSSSGVSDRHLLRGEIKDAEGYGDENE
jgi:hypothetical protein